MSLILSLSFSSDESALAEDPVASAYARMLGALLPPGKLWRLVTGSTLYQLLLGCADELSRVEARTTDLLNEADPTTAFELLPEYESELGLEQAATLDERRARIVSRLVARQRFRPVDVQQALAPLLGQDPEDVDVREQSAAFASSIDDPPEIFRFLVHRDPNEPGTYFLESAQDLVDQIKPSHTIGQIVESIDALYDDPFTLYDRDLRGA